MVLSWWVLRGLVAVLTLVLGRFDGTPRRIWVGVVFAMRYCWEESHVVKTPAVCIWRVSALVLECQQYGWFFVVVVASTGLCGKASVV